MTNNNSTKERIKFCFNKAADTYDQACAIQVQTGIELINLLQHNKHSYPKIIDLGCGTGLITKKLADTIQNDEFHAIDFASKLLGIAKSRLLNHKIDLYEADYDSLDVSSNSFDLAFSNMTLQWSLDLSNTLIATKNLLNPNGTLAFSIPIEGSLLELEKESSNQFHTINFITDSLREHGFTTIKCSTKKYSAHFPNIFEALKSIKKVGANCLIEKKKRNLTGKSFLNHTMSSKTKNFSLTYNIGFFTAKKPGDKL
jgi:malonyl-CoA O-methyltransferase